MLVIRDCVPCVGASYLSYRDLHWSIIDQKPEVPFKDGSGSSECLARERSTAIHVFCDRPTPSPLPGVSFTIKLR